MSEPEVPPAGRKPRSDKGTVAIRVPKTVAEALKRAAVASGRREVWQALADRQAEVVALLMGEGAALPESVVTKLRIASKAADRPLADLLAELESDLCALMDGKLFRVAASGGVGDYEAIPGLRQRLHDMLDAGLEGP